MSENDIIREDVKQDTEDMKQDAEEMQMETEQAVQPDSADKAEPEKKKKKKKEKVKKSLGREILEWVLTIVVAVAAALVIRSFIFELVRVDGGSMENTLDDQEIMFVSKFDYSSTWLSLPFQSNNATERAPRIVIGTPNRLDIVICRYPGRGGVNFVKRIVGLPGEYVSLKEGYLNINGEEIPEEKTIDGITDDYRGLKIRSGYAYTYSPYYVPKKGDSLVITADGLFQINGEAWNRMQTCIVAKNGEGKTLKIYTRNKNESSKENQVDYRTDTETVYSYDGKVYTPEQFRKSFPDMIGGELTIDEDYYFVMGDHRNNSNDSRYVGALERSAIIGHARSVVYPFNKWRGVD